MLAKSSIGFFLVLLIQLAARSKWYYLSALLPLFPSMALFSYYFVGQNHSVETLQETIVFGMFSLLPYFCFLLALYFSVRGFRIVPALWLASGAWLVVAAVQIQAWPWVRAALGFRAS
ncbi:GlpM family protein [Uliginosibacterium gangwonense]|uniref:GlpM family protein n=1 Tax=Uliginosibacterium gangwonense TaxID=392736 RepID=UPI00039D4925|nr:GlpM family protein [Uliginosibacterium gangwonense]